MAGTAEDFINAINDFNKYCKLTLYERNENEELELELYQEEENFNPEKYKIMVYNLLITGLRFKVRKMTLLDPKQFNSFIGLVTGKNNLSIDKMEQISQYIPILLEVTRALEVFSQEDANCFVYLLNPNTNI